MKKNGTLKKYLKKNIFDIFHVFWKYYPPDALAWLRDTYLYWKVPKKWMGVFFVTFQAKIGPRAHRFSTEQTHNPYWKPVFDLQSGLPLLGALPPDPRQGVTPWTPFFLLIKGTDIDWHFWKKGSKFQFFFSTTIFKGPKRVAAKRVFTHGEAPGGACIAFAPVRRGPRYAT